MVRTDKFIAHSTGFKNGGSDLYVSVAMVNCGIRWLSFPAHVLSSELTETILMSFIRKVRVTNRRDDPTS